jgi:hypothetical protein
MTERFVLNGGTISIENGSSTVTGIGTLFGGADRAGAQLWHVPDDGPPVRIGSVAEIAPPNRGIYDNLSLPLVSPWNGADLDGVAYELIDSVAIARGASQVAIYARFVAFLEQNAGLTFNTADAIDYALVPNNSLFVDAVTRTVYQWRNGVLVAVEVVGGNFNPRGAYAGGTTYAKNDLVTHGGYVYVSNAAGNVGNTPNTAPASSSFWTYLPLPGPSDGYAIAVNIGGRPAAGELIPAHVFADTVEFPAGSTVGRAIAGVAFTAESVFALWRNGSPVATATFAAAGTVATVTAASGFTCTPGDYVDVKCPAVRDATGADIRMTWRGTR